MSETRDFTAGRHAYVALSILFGVFIAVSLWGWLYIHESFWKALALWSGAYIVTLVWLRAFKVTISESELIFRSLFGERRMRHDEIAIIRLGFDFSHGGGPLRLFVEPKDESSVRPMSINAKILTRDGIRAVLDLGSRVARSDSGGLEDGIVMRTIRKRRSKKT